MKVSLLCIGDELLKGATVNTNMAYVGQKLLEIGIVSESAVVALDKKENLVKALDNLLAESDLVISTGGLGPTADDVTRPVIAEYFGRKMYQEEEIKKQLSERWLRLKRGPIPERLMTQTFVPEGSDILPNNVGTAPGTWLTADWNGKEKHVVMLPGPPMELEPMFEESVLPRLKGMLKGKLFSKLYFVADTPESIAEDKMQPVIKENDQLSVAYCASPGNVKLFLSSFNEKQFKKACASAEEIFKDKILSNGCNSLAEEISKLLRERKSKISTAESCTGGMIAAALTDISGSSDIFPGSIVSYSNECKEKILGVSSETLKNFGAVSEECAKEMLMKVCEKFGTEGGISATGIAGPSGGTKEKPVGLVYIGVKFKDKVLVRKNNFSGNREMVRYRTATTAFNMLRNLILGQD
jgi:nicotinamide-nucleotide amidase